MGTAPVDRRHGGRSRPSPDLGGPSADDVFWLYSETVQQVDFLDAGMNVIFSRSPAAREIATVNVDTELGITDIPYGVSLAGEAPFVATFHDSPDYLGGMQVFDRSPFTGRPAWARGTGLAMPRPHSARPPASVRRLIAHGADRGGTR